MRSWDTGLSGGAEVGKKFEEIVKRILICEDERDMALSLRAAVERVDMAADIACDAAQAKQMLEQNGYAAITVDLTLPVQSGINWGARWQGQNAKKCRYPSR